MKTKRKSNSIESMHLDTDFSIYEIKDPEFLAVISDVIHYPNDFNISIGD
ncbi:hypothetical protein [Aquimarina sp. RZ0]|nr:hypothetical protein [Aquimarina sp. RZ0]